jgi:hypothetical protein
MGQEKRRDDRRLGFYKSLLCLLSEKLIENLTNLNLKKSPTKQPEVKNSQTLRRRRTASSITIRVRHRRSLGT